VLVDALIISWLSDQIFVSRLDQTAIENSGIREPKTDSMRGLD